MLVVAGVVSGAFVDASGNVLLLGTDFDKGCFPRVDGEIGIEVDRRSIHGVRRIQKNRPMLECAFLARNIAGEV